MSQSTFCRGSFVVKLLYLYIWQMNAFSPTYTVYFQLFHQSHRGLLQHCLLWSVITQVTTTQPSNQILMDPHKQGQMTVGLKNGNNTSSSHLSKKVLQHVVYQSRLHVYIVPLVLSSYYHTSITTYSFITDTEGAEVHYYKSLRRDQVVAGMSTHSLYIIAWGKPKQALNLHHLEDHVTKYTE